MIGSTVPAMLGEKMTTSKYLETSFKNFSTPGRLTCRQPCLWSHTDVLYLHHRAHHACTRGHTEVFD